MMRLRRYCVCVRECPPFYFWTLKGARRFFNHMQCVYLYRFTQAGWEEIDKRIWS